MKSKSNISLELHPLVVQGKYMHLMLMVRCDVVQARDSPSAVPISCDTLKEQHATVTNLMG